MESREVMDLQPLISDAIRYVKEELDEEILDVQWNNESSYVDVDTAVKTELHEEDVDDEQQGAEKHSSLREASSRWRDDFSTKQPTDMSDSSKLGYGFHHNLSDVNTEFKSSIRETNVLQTGTAQNEDTVQENVLSCGTSANIFNGISPRQQKLLNQNGTDTADICCNICGKVFLQEAELNVHKLTHKKFHNKLSEHNAISNPYQCDICNGVFKDNRYLEQHKTVHDSEGKYKCTVCNTVFTTFCKLMDHKCNHCRKYQCDICDKIFETSYMVDTHNRLVHNICHSYKYDVHNTEYKIESHFSESRTLKDGDKSKNECKTCLRKFRNSSELGVHELVHSNVRNHECDVCGTRFKRSYHLLRHKLTVHRKKKNAMPNCLSQCMSVNSDETKVITEVINQVAHSDVEEFKCNICNKTFTRHNSLLQHKSSFHSDNNDFRRHKCTVCNKTFTTGYKLSQHKSLFHSDNSGIENFKCNVCDKIFTRDDRLLQHKLSFHSDNSDCRSHKCNICDKTFTKGYSLFQHKLLFHSDNSDVTKYNCNLCDKAFMWAHNLKKHKLKHHSSNSAISVHNCNVCDKTFTSAAHLLQHKLEHDGNNSDGRKYKCNLCDKAFIWPQGLKRHKLSVHRNQKNGSHEATDCLSQLTFHRDDNDKTFREMDSSSKLKLPNQVVPAKSSSRKYKCNLCDKAFIWPQGLKRHKLKHYDRNCVIRVHNCNVCDKTFTSAAHLLQHKLEHDSNNSDGRKYKCNLCDKAFIWPQGLKRHKLSVHRVKKKYSNKVLNGLSQHASFHQGDNNKAFPESGESSEVMLYNHVLAEDSVVRKYKCNVCDKAFTRSHHLSRHKLTVHRNKKKESNKVPESLSQHVTNRIDGNNAFTVADDNTLVPKSCNQVVDSDIKKYKCDECDKAFIWPPNLSLHKLSVHMNKKNDMLNHLSQCMSFHNDDDKTVGGTVNQVMNSDIAMYKCNVCDKTFTRSDLLMQHKLVLHSNVHYKCDLCDKVFTWPQNLKKHKLSVHHSHTNESEKAPNSLLQNVSFRSDDENTVFTGTGDSAELSLCGTKIEVFKCDEYGENFEKACYLSQHKPDHVDVKYKCNVCNRSFVDPDLLLQHMSLHSDDSRHRRDVCNRVNENVENLEQHKDHHRKTEKFECDMCDKMFTTSYNLLEHRSADHNFVTEYNCDVCDKGFVTAELLSQHVSLHSDDSCHQCETCNKVYIKLEHLLQHKLIHNHE